MFIAQFLLTGDVHDFHVQRVDSIASLGKSYSNDPVGFKNAIDQHFGRFYTNDPGQRTLLMQLLPFVGGKAATSGLDIVQQIRKETAPQRNYLHLGETRCGLVQSWWNNICSGDIRV